MAKEKGVFITFEGPNGVGKSIILETVAEQVSKTKDIVTTKEPTNSDLGEMAREGEEYLSEYSLALLVAADRYSHLSRTVIPALENSQIVLCDRYVESSLVLQHIDGLSLNYIWELNKKIKVPDLSIILTAKPKVLGRRLSKRKKLSKFEREASRSKELLFYREAANFIEQKGFNVHLQNNDLNTPKKEIAQKIAKKIIKIKEESPANN